MNPIAYTIGSLVTDLEQYAQMRASLEAGGFTSADCEYLYIDNTREPQTDAYAGLNQLLNRARGRRVILCHQDILLISDGRAELDARLDELTQRDPRWAVAANAGGVSSRHLAIRITDKHGDNQHQGKLPARVVSVDENFVVVRAETRVGFSRDLEGFHLYGADLCMVADMLGHSAYVIDFHLRHLGQGRTGEPFARCRDAFLLKWQHALRDRQMKTTCTYLLLSGRREPAWLHGLRQYLSHKFSPREPSL